MENENVSIHHQPVQLNNPNMEIDNESWQREAEHSMRDWQQVRIQAAIAAMQGQLANQVLTENMIESVENVDNFPKVVANASVRIADALIAELQKKGD